MFATNHLGPFLLTNLLLPALTASGAARVLTVSAPSGTKLKFDDLLRTTRNGPAGFPPDASRAVGDFPSGGAHPFRAGTLRLTEVDL
jgi:NAD(P)-dependent dehydrogenase (short-subunit alcohol dehydrogenase family)